jgi:hypothetical protein
MDNIIQKFYSNGKDGPAQYSQFGAFSSNMIQNQNPISSLSTKAISDIKPAYKKITPKTQPLNYRSEPYIPPKPPRMTQEEFLRPKKLMFNSSSDMLFNNLRYNPRGEIGLMKENLSLMNKKNATKIQMIEEKMKNLELKNQRLEVINDFFFDMFENNLIQDEIKKQRLKKFEEENKIINEDSSEYNDINNYNENYYRKKRKKFKKSRSNVDLNRYERFKKKEFDPIAFQQKTEMNARAVLNNIKNNLGTYLVEEELKKNEQFQSLNEGINELKTDLNNKLEKIQKNQNQQMQKIYYCLLNSGDKNVESAAFRLLNDFENRNNKFIRKTSIGNSFRKSARPSQDSLMNIPE